MSQTSSSPERKSAETPESLIARTPELSSPKILGTSSPSISMYSKNVIKSPTESPKNLIVANFFKRRELKAAEKEEERFNKMIGNLEENKISPPRINK